MNSSLTSPPVVGDGRGGLYSPVGLSRENDSAFARYLIERAKLRLALARSGALHLGTYLNPAAYAPEKGAVLPPCSGGPTDAELSARGSASFSFIHQPSPREKAERLYDALVRLRDQARQMHMPSKELSRCVELAGARLIGLQSTEETS